MKTQLVFLPLSTSTFKPFARTFAQSVTSGITSAIAWSVALTMTLSACGPGSSQSHPAAPTETPITSAAPQNGAAAGAPSGPSSATPTTTATAGGANGTAATSVDVGTGANANSNLGIGAGPTSSSSSKLNQPWQSPQNSIVIDAYQGNAIDWNLLATDARVAGVVHRSSYGLHADSAYSERRAIATQRGYLWGAFHVGTSEDPIQQAQFFLQTVGDDPRTLWALDLEDIESTAMMNAANAEIFLDYVFQHTGRLPILYANNSVVLGLNQRLSQNSLAAHARLWYARFVTKISKFPTGLWSDFFLWQFSSEINCSKTGSCLYNVPGTSFDIDVDVFNGSKEALSAQWK